MDIKTTVRVGAYIIRQDFQGFHELLLFKHPACLEAPVQLPGGGVEPQESLEEALHREILEETGLQNLTILRKLGVAETYWQRHQLICQRHCFLLSAASPIANSWDHFVKGEGVDAGLCFSYFWCRPNFDFQLSPELGHFLSREYIPELYDG